MPLKDVAKFSVNVYEASLMNPSTGQQIGTTLLPMFSADISLLL